MTITNTTHRPPSPIRMPAISNLRIIPHTRIMTLTPDTIWPDTT